MNQTFMKERAILPLVLAMAIPNMLSMLVNSLYNIVDTYFVAQISENAMTALSLLFPVQNLSLGLAVGFGVGINAVISRLMGMEEQERADRAATVGVLFCGLHGILLMVFCIAAAGPFLRLYSEDTEVVRLGVEYARIVFMGCIMQHVGIGLEKIYQSVGRMLTSMAALILGCVVNIFLDPVFIFGLGPVPAMGIAGAALATILGQMASMVVYIGANAIHPLPVHFSGKALVVERRLLMQLYAVGIPASLTIALPSLMISALNRILAEFSQMYINVLGIYYKLQTFVYMPASGIIQGIRPLMGYNFGAGKWTRVHRIYRVSMGLSALMMAVGTVICFGWPGELMALFSEQQETIQAGAVALPIIALGFLASAVSITSCGALEGLGMGYQSLIISLLRYVAVILPLALLFSRFMDAEGVWHAFWVAEVLTAGISFFLYRRVIQKTIAHLL